MGREPFMVVLPARYASTRFPGKPLVKIGGKPLIEWVYRGASRIEGVGELVVATDDRRIARAVEDFGGRAVMTAADHATGTDRVAEVARAHDFPLVVNLQGDEPVFDPRSVETMVDLLAAEADTDIVTACHRIDSVEDFENPNIVKVVMSLDGRALYFSRSPVPSGALEGGAGAYRHVGIYVYRRNSLLRFTSLDPTPLERSERLEQLRAIENGMIIKLVVIKEKTVGVDVPEDVKNVEKELGRI
jgi:3-deoxy-manno-octulosonate cytidylyltransferase (CMP-KDO synthetase)